MDKKRKEKRKHPSPFVFVHLLARRKNKKIVHSIKTSDERGRIDGKEEENFTETKKSGSLGKSLRFFRVLSWLRRRSRKCVEVSFSLLSIWRRNFSGKQMVFASMKETNDFLNLLQIPYFIMLFAAGLPIFFLEILLGQYSGVGPVKTFGHLVPILRGLGYV